MPWLTSTVQWGLNSAPIATTLVFSTLLLLLIKFFTHNRTPSISIPVLSGSIPRLSITILYMTNMKTFLSRARSALREKNIVQFYLGPTKAYLVSGPSNVGAMFRTSSAVSSEVFMLMIHRYIWDAPAEDRQKFAHDKSGRVANTKGAERDGSVAEEGRYWAGMHSIMHRYLSRASEMTVLASNYQRFFNERLERRFAMGVPTKVHIYDLLRQDMAAAVITALNGTQVLEMHPNLLEMLWEFDDIAATLVWGLPRFLNRDAYAKRDRLNGATVKFLEAAFEDFDWERDEKEDPEWDSVLGCRFTRQTLRWMRQRGFTVKTMAGALTNMTIFG